MPSPRALADRLLALRYAGLFLSTPRQADGVLAEVADAELAALVADSAEPAEARFLAAELWFERHRELPPSPDAAKLGELYARALADGWVAEANAWGLPGQIGPIGRHLLLLGPAAVPALRARLGDATAVSYAGSEEATVGNRYQYRVKDLAAFYLSRVAPAPYALHATPGERDREIQKLAELVATP